MTLTTYLPRLGLLDRVTRKPKHRASDEVERLRHRLAGADLLLAGYRVQLDDKDREHAETIARIDERHAETVRGLEQQVRDLQWRLDIACKAETAVAKTQELDVSGLDNFADSVRTLAQAHCIGPVLDPGHI